MTLRGKLALVERTDVGMVREHNEDFVKSNLDLGIAILADGMGGLNAGEVASSMSAHVLMDKLSEFVIERNAATTSDDEPVLELYSERLVTAVEEANDAVFHASQTQVQYRGMGTTVVAAVFHDDYVTVAHIGDSRMYRFRDGDLEAVTKDHSFVQELMDQGLYTREEARASAQKNVVTRAVGIAPTVEVEVNQYPLEVGDLFLLCSDGLTDLVADETIEKSLGTFGDDLEGLAAYLIDLANASGGKDNISIVLVMVCKALSGSGTLIEKLVNWFE